MVLVKLVPEDGTIYNFLQWFSPQYMAARSPKMVQLVVLHEVALQGTNDNKSHSELKAFSLEQKICTKGSYPII